MRVEDLGGISGDGQVVVFDALAYLPTGAARLPFVYQQATGKARNVLGNKYIGRRSGEGSVDSLHGNLVTIGTDARLTEDDNRRREDVYLLRLGTGKFTLLTHQNLPTTGGTSAGPGMHPLSRDGRVLLFETGRAIHTRRHRPRS